jgi:hypothetical protein
MSHPLHRARFWLNHRWAPPHMSDYLDHELRSGPRRRLDRHVAECEECRRLLGGLRELLRVLHGLPTPSGVDAARIAASVWLRSQEPGSST